MAKLLTHESLSAGEPAKVCSPIAPGMRGHLNDQGHALCAVAHLRRIQK